METKPTGGWFVATTDALFTVTAANSPKRFEL